MMIPLLDVGSYACEPNEDVISVSVVDLTIGGNEITYFAAGMMVFEGTTWDLPRAGFCYSRLDINGLN